MRRVRKPANGVQSREERGIEMSKIGDLVIVYLPGKQGIKEGKIEKITPTTVIVSGIRYRRWDGLAVDKKHLSTIDGSLIID